MSDEEEIIFSSRTSSIATLIFSGVIFLISIFNISDSSDEYWWVKVVVTGLIFLFFVYNIASYAVGKVVLTNKNLTLNCLLGQIMDGGPEETKIENINSMEFGKKEIIIGYDTRINGNVLKLSHHIPSIFEPGPLSRSVCEGFYDAVVNARLEGKLQGFDIEKSFERKKRGV